MNSTIMGPFLFAFLTKFVKNTFCTSKAVLYSKPIVIFLLLTHVGSFSATFPNERFLLQEDQQILSVLFYHRKPGKAKLKEGVNSGEHHRSCRPCK